jgi:hypothetical protein
LTEIHRHRRRVPEQVTANFAAVEPGCPALVRTAFRAALAPWPSRAALARHFTTCENASNSLLTIQNIEGMAWQRVEGWGEFFYPFAVSNRSTIGPACRRMAAAAAAAAAEEEDEAAAEQRSTAAAEQRSTAAGESKRLLVESPWSQLTSECQRF